MAPHRSDASDAFLVDAILWTALMVAAILALVALGRSACDAFVGQDGPRETLCARTGL
jgi:hypothetical protein